MDILGTVMSDVKFFPRDVIGKQPKKVGDIFRAEFFGMVKKWKVTHFFGTHFHAEAL